jgi:chromate transporter
MAREWGRIGCTGFGGPPAHIALLRELCVRRNGWLSAAQFEHAIGATNMLPGPASTQTAIYCAWRVRGARGALVGGALFILPGLIMILALSALFLTGSPPGWLRGAGLGAGAAVAAVALRAGLTLAGPIWARTEHARRPRVLIYGLTGAVAAALAGPWLVAVLLACGVCELVLSGAERRGGMSLHLWPALLASRAPIAPLAAWRGRRVLPIGGPASWRSHPSATAAITAATTATATAASGGAGALVWTALKVGALAFGGGFVIVPLMQGDAVNTYHWMTHSQFLNAVALGQVTPGPVVLTVAAVGYAAAGVPGGLLATAVAFAPSFAFVLLGASRFERLIANARAGAFMSGAAPAACGAILGASIPLAGAIAEPSWQAPILAGAAAMLFVLRRGVVMTLLAAGAVGALAVGLAGAPLPS